jgi:hypothetical protein
MRLVYPSIICAKLKYFYYLLKGSSLKRAGGQGRDRGWELGKGREAPWFFRHPDSCRGTGMRFIETCLARGSINSGNLMSS